MEIGLHLPSAQPGANADDILLVAQTAERLGFDALWMFDHLFTPTDLGSKYPYSRDGSYAMSAEDPFFDPLGLFGVLAGATERIKIGTGVLIGAYRHPIVLAKTLATIERFAPGRIILGIGTGWMEEEFDALDVPFPRRGARLTEYMTALRALWSGAPNAFDGEFYSWPASGFLPAPSARIPLIVGGHSDLALRRAAEHGDGWAVVTGRGQGSGLAGAKARIDLVQEMRAEAGTTDRPFDFLFQNLLWFSDEPNPKMPFTGPPDAIARSLKEAESMGVSMVDLIVFGPGPVVAETAQRFAEEVRPLL